MSNYHILNLYKWFEMKYNVKISILFHSNQLVSPILKMNVHFLKKIVCMY